MSRRLTRRAFVGGAAAASVGTVAAGTLAVFATRPEDDPAAPASTATTEPAPSTAPSASPQAPVSPKQGGAQHILAPGRIDPDTFDAQLTGESTTIEILGRTHSRLLNWDPGKPGHLTNDLVQRFEQPDDLTLVLHLDPKARWHGRPPLDGRPLVAADVVKHLQRALAIAEGGKSPLAQRYHDYAGIASVDSPGEGQVRIRLEAPNPRFLGVLAGEFALVQAPEAVEAFAALWPKLDSDHVIGTGPWLFDWSDRGAKFAAFRDGHRAPWLDELVVADPHDPAGRFVSTAVQEAIVRDRRDAAAIAAHFPVVDAPGTLDSLELQRAVTRGEVFVSRRFEREIVMSSFFVGAPPWNNPELLVLISAALNRHELARRLFGGRATPSGPLPPALGGSISAERLKFIPGYAFLDDYRPDPALKQRWQAAGGPGLGPVTVDFPSVFDPRYSASSIVIDMLNEALGPQFRPAVETYTTISRRVVEGYYGNGRAAFWFGWGAPLPSPLPADYFAETYAPGSPGQRVTGGSGVGGSGQDDLVKLAERGFSGIVPWVQQYAEVYRAASAYGPAPSPFWGQHADIERVSFA